ncbi:MAG: RES family NAD+ phosphorylase [Candidatus Accumulibacter delftensis]|jgi:hypothetical protein
MQLLCENCIRDEHLRSVVADKGLVVDRCAICGADNVLALSSEDIDLKSRFRALIRYHFSEWHYNHHMGGDGLESLFYTDNPITNYQDSWDIEKYEKAILVVLDPAYEDYEKGICLFAGYTDGVQNLLLVAIKNDCDGQLRDLQRQSRERNFFLIESLVKAAIEPRTPDIEATLAKGAKLFRTRIGYEARATPLMGWGDERHYRPFSKNQISAPPPIISSAGRMNRAGVSFLYLATDAETAVAETRPHPGHYCSYGEFESTRDLRIADLSSLVVTDFATSDKRLDEYLLLKTLDDLFSMPITPEGRAEYQFTQLLADCFRQLVFDAICYRSSVGSGKNYVVFDPSNLAYIDGSGRVVKIEELSYQFSEMVIMEEDDSYITDLNGEFR